MSTEMNIPLITGDAVEKTDKNSETPNIKKDQGKIFKTSTSSKSHAFVQNLAKRATQQMAFLRTTQGLIEQINNSDYKLTFWEEFSVIIQQFFNYEHALDYLVSKINNKIGFAGKMAERLCQIDDSLQSRERTDLSKVFNTFLNKMSDSDRVAFATSLVEKIYKTEEPNKKEILEKTLASVINNIPDVYYTHLRPNETEQDR
ncbi:MAG: hypothetical protein K2L13_02765, partial [Opitutales bacterium]|nr:hypothetical protein [Opitutales bacterium]